jgi:hypothetical protein
MHHIHRDDESQSQAFHTDPKSPTPPFEKQKNMRVKFFLKTTNFPSFVINIEWLRLVLPR